MQGIEALRRGDIGVRSLQDWVRDEALPDVTYRALFDHGLPRIDPEKAHRLGFRAIRRRAAGARPAACARRRPVEAMGLTFPNVLGLAAGFDKNAVGIDALAALGFGHVEVGTVTGEPQPGNPTAPAVPAARGPGGGQPDGVQQRRRRGRRRAAGAARAAPRGRRGPVLGVNIGKTKVGARGRRGRGRGRLREEHPAARAARRLPGRQRELAQHARACATCRPSRGCEPLLEQVRRVADEVTDDRVPLLVKIAPDLADKDVLAVADLAVAIGLDGIIATNTTISRDGLRLRPGARSRPPALAGCPARRSPSASLDVMRLLRDRVGDDLTLIGVGGITTADDARARLDAGADLLQGYTAFVYEGPGWPRRILKGVSRP